MAWREKLGRRKAEKQPQEKAERFTHGLILPKPGRMARSGDRASTMALGCLMRNDIFLWKTVWK